MSDDPIAKGLPPVDLHEYGGKKDGEKQKTNRRLFMQLLVVDIPEGMDADAHAKELLLRLRDGAIPAVVYADMNDPHGIGVVTWDEDPAHFVDRVRPVFAEEKLADLVFRPELGMIGRSYSSGYENDLEFWLIRRPIETLMHDGWDWAVWYPLRRTGAFNRLPREEQGAILREHGMIGKTYGEQDLAHDIRLACHGLDANDNEFLIGLIGKELFPLSHVVQTMRGTRQTAEYMQQMGPFFVGRVVRRVRGKAR
mgnify:CR=1 FL=1